MLSVESLPVAEEEVVESCSNKLGDIYTFVANGCFPHTMNPLRKKNLKRYAQKFIIDDGKLYYVGPKKVEKREVVIEAERKRQIFLDCHFNDVGHHLGQKKTVHRIQTQYYWLGIVKDVVDWIKVCETCRHAERSKSLARTARPIKVDSPWEIVGIDFLGPFPETRRGNQSLVLVLDYFSKWAEAFPVQKADAVSVARCVSTCVYRFGAPKTITCSQNADFCSEVTRVLCERWTLVQKVSPADRSQLNPLHDTTAPLLREAVVRMVAEKQADWDDFLDAVLFLFRTSANPTTRFSPYSLMFNRKVNLPDEATPTLPDQDWINLDQDSYFTKEKASTFMSLMQEQQDAVKQLVVANMNAAYKQQKKKNSKRRAHHAPAVTFKFSEPLFLPGDSPPSKKAKESLYLSFPVETALDAEQGAAGHIKAGLAFHLADADVQ